ncbi:lactonase family protein [Echinicola sediminis]
MLFGLLSCGQSASDKAETPVTETPTIKFWMGTYTSNPNQGIHLIAFDPDTYQFDSLLLQGNVNNPSFVITNNAGDLVFSVQEEGGENGGSVCSFRFDSKTASLEKISTSSTLGSGPCFITLDPSEKYILAGNYGSGDLAVIPILENGSLGPAVQDIQHQGNSVNKDRQQGPHVHSLTFHPNGTQVFVADLGTDKVNIYDFDPSSETPLSESSPAYFEVKPGSGPRHLAFNKTGDRIYLIHEMTSEVGLYAYDLEDKTIRHIETYPLVQEGFQGELGAAEIKISSDGKYLYASNRGDSNEIVVFRIQTDSGKLEKIQTISSGGETPRNFSLSPDGKFLFTANQNSHNIIAHKRNPETGIISPLESEFSIHKPVYFFMLD